MEEKKATQGPGTGSDQIPGKKLVLPLPAAVNNDYDK